MNVVKEFNGLNGVKVSREHIQAMIEKAQKQEQFPLAERLENVLRLHPDQNLRFEIETPAFEVAPESILSCLECHSDDNKDIGLNKAISPDDIYNEITQMIINTINEVGHLPWQKDWHGSGSGQEAKNYVTKKPYTGINFLLLNFDAKKADNGKYYLVPIDFVQPYYLTFNQIKASKAKLKKDSKARRVMYYTMIFEYKSETTQFRTTDKEKFNEFAKLHNLTAADIKKYLKKFPILKYYNVYRADHCTGLKFPPAPEKKKTNPIDQAQAIIDGYQNAPKYTFVGDRAYYSPMEDFINMPAMEAFNKEASYYCTFFHEMIHSTGHPKRLDRFSASDAPTKKEYAFEELVAELGAVFLCSDSGILFHTRENSAKYLKGWNRRLIGELEDDNRFFLKASAQAQKAATLILGEPKQEKAATKVEKKKVRSSTVKNVSARVQKFDGKKATERYNLREDAIMKVLTPEDRTAARKEWNALEKKTDWMEFLQAKADEKENQQKSSDIVNTKTTVPELKQRTRKKPTSKTGQLALFGPKKKPGLKAPMIEREISSEVQQEIAAVEESKPTPVKPVPSSCKAESKSISSLKNLGFVSAAEVPEEAEGIFVLPGEIGEFIQKIQPHKALIIIKGTKHTSKSQLAMQVANAFGEMDSPVAYIDYEQGGMESKDTVDSINRNTTEKGRKNILIKGHLEKPFEELKQFCKFCKVIIADSVTDLGITADQLNELRNGYTDVIWVFISQVKENGEMYGGNKMAHNPTCIIECHPSHDPKERYATLAKNRGNDLDLKYSMFDKKLIREPQPEIIPGTPEKTIFSFEVQEN